MKVILDENVPIQTARFLSGHDVTTVQREGWAGIGNGDLLNLIDGKFDVMLLADKNLRYQQNLAARQLAILVVQTTNWPEIQKHLGPISDAVNALKPGDFTELKF